jgi:transposase
MPRPTAVDKPSDKTLRWLHIDQAMSGRAIAQRYGVSPHKALKWLREAGLMPDQTQRAKF